jgi:hypothetical protein
VFDRVAVLLPVLVASAVQAEEGNLPGEELKGDDCWLAVSSWSILLRSAVLLNRLLLGTILAAWLLVQAECVKGTCAKGSDESMTVSVDLFAMCEWCCNHCERMRSTRRRNRKLQKV